MIVLKIDVTKIDKERLFAGKNGAKYLDLVLLDSKNDKYGNDYMVVQGVSKEERENGVRGAILGNGKNLGGPRETPRQPSRQIPDHQKYNTSDEEVDEDSIPF